MKVYEGRKIHKKIGIGPICFFENTVVYNAYKTIIKDKAKELERLMKSLSNTDLELLDIYTKACSTVSKDKAEIFDVHRMLLKDDSYIDDIKNLIVTESVCAEYAVNETSKKYIEFFNNSSNKEMMARAIDIKDVNDRIIGNLLGKKRRMVFERPSIILSNELTPSEVISLNKEKVRGIVTKNGSVNSHAAILARSMDIPMIVVEDDSAFLFSKDKFGIVDGEKGEFIVEPDDETMEIYVEKLKLQKEERDKLTEYLDKVVTTKSGKVLKVFANVSKKEDVDFCLQNNADGIGLFRTEFLFLNKETPPTLKEQVKVYGEVLKIMKEKPVTFRTFDLGGDKRAGYLKLPTEENPSMGLRGIRLSLSYRDLFKTQLKALFEISVEGNVSICLPMITSEAEIDRVYELIEEVKEELVNERIPFVIPKIGFMIETPAAVMISDRLSKRAAFFCIGTNDLYQYACALDRQNGYLMDFFEPYHEAVLRMIDLVIENAKKQNIPVGICGEMAQDKVFVEKYHDRLDYFSVHPASVLNVRKIVSDT